MPELPEVETIRRGLRPILEGQKLISVIVRRGNLRIPFPKNFSKKLVGKKIISLKRRAKYLLMHIEGGDVVEPLGTRVLGRIVARDVVGADGEKLVGVGTMVDESVVADLDQHGIDEMWVRSPITCETKYGVCAACYGRDLARGHLVNVGETVGVIAAQSIGEPGTQLTMRTFHIGGAASRATAIDNIQVKHGGVVRLHNLKTVTRESGELVAVSRSGEIAIADE